MKDILEKKVPGIDKTYCHKCKKDTLSKNEICCFKCSECGELK